MTWLPWRRVKRAERMADEAEESLAAARVELREVMALAEESRRIKQRNGFADAIRSAMGVGS